MAAFEGRFGKVEQEATSQAGRVDQRLSKADVDIGGFRTDVTQRFAKVDVELAAIRGDITLLKWMLGFVLAGVSALVVRGLF